MKLPRDLDGRTLVRVLCREWDYRVINQEGSHIILQTDSPAHPCAGSLSGAHRDTQQNPAIDRRSQGGRAWGYSALVMKA